MLGKGRPTVFGCLVLALAAHASTEWDSISTPLIDVELSRPAELVEPARIDASSVESFVSGIPTESGETLFLAAKNIFRVNSLLTPQSVDQLKTVLHALPSRACGIWAGRIDLTEDITLSFSIHSEKKILMGRGWSAPSGLSDKGSQSAAPPNLVGALSHYRNFLDARGELRESTVLLARGYGEGGHILLRSYEDDISPRIPSDYRIMRTADTSQEISLLNATAASMAIRVSVSVDSPDGRKQFAKSYLELMHPQSILVESTTQIPTRRGARTVDTDLADAIGPYREFASSCHSEGSETTMVVVFYSYQQIGGILRRHRFEFWDSPFSPKILEPTIAERIGDARFLL